MAIWNFFWSDSFERVLIKCSKKHTKGSKKPKNKRWQMSYILIVIVACIINKDRLNGTWVKCHLVAINPGGNYQDNLLN